MIAPWMGIVGDIATNPLVLLLTLLALAYGADRLFGADGRLLPLIILAVAPPIGWLSGYELPPEIRSLGLVMFIYVIGLEAGRSFFPTFRKHWRRFLLIGVGAGVGAGAVAWCIGRMFGWTSDAIAAFYAGAITSTPAFESLRGVASQPVASALFDLVYYTGVLCAVAAVLAIHFAWSGHRESASTSQATDDDGLTAPYFVSLHRCTNRALVGQPMEQAILHGIPHSQAVRYQRGDDVRPVTDHDVCSEGDLIVLVSASPRLTEMGRVFVGPDEEPDMANRLMKDLPVRFETVRVTATQFIDARVHLKDIEDEYGVEVRGWWRGREYFPARAAMRWRQGDRLRVLGTPERVRQFRYLVEEEGSARSEEIDLLRFSIGAVVAVFIGALTLPLGSGMYLSLGVTGGALLAGLVFGRSARIQIPRGAAFFIKELGLGLFLAGVGTSVGTQGPIAMADLVIVPATLAVAAIPVLVAMLLSRKADFSAQFVEGAACGSVTSTPALIVATRMAETSEPATTYAGIYLFALLTSVGVAQALVLFG
jgi:putative transport protein